VSHSYWQRGYLAQHNKPDATTAGPSSASRRARPWWRPVTLREGTRGRHALPFRAAACAARPPAHRDEERTEPRSEEWLLIEWPQGDAEPTKYWLSTLPATTPVADLVRLAKLRWLIERDYQELKDELGLDHFEGRGWRGFHHHGALCIAAYAFLAAERARFSPRSLSPSSGPLAFPKASRRGVLPVRPERHVPTSIATAYELLARALLQRRPCRSCGRSPETG
jgi:Transposase DDE domain